MLKESRLDHLGKLLFESVYSHGLLPGDLFGLEKNDFIEQVNDVIPVGEFYEIAAGGQIIFT